MANIRAIATGNWSAGGTWNGGVPPGVGDNAFANTFTVTIDQDITCTSISTAAGGGGSAGGGFSCIVGRTINANVTGGTTYALNCTHTTGTVTVNGNVVGGSAGTAYGIYHQAAGLLVVNGNVTGGTNTVTYGIGCVTTAGSVTITGNVSGGTGGQSHGLNSAGTSNPSITIIGALTGGNTGSNSNGATIGSSCTFTHSGGAITGGSSGTSNYGMSVTAGTVNGTITANITAGPGGVGSIGANFSHTAGTITINGNVLGTNFGGGVVCAGTGITTINGTATGGGASTNNYGAAISTAGTLNINGNVTSGTVGYGVSCTGPGSTTTITGNVTCVATTSSSHAIQVTSSANLVVNGDVTGPSGAGLGTTVGVHALGSGNVTITGTCTGGNSTTSPGLYIQGALASCRVGTAKSNDYPNGGIVNPNPGVQMTANTYSCTVDALEFGSGGFNPLSAVGKWFIRAAGTNSVKMRESNAGAVVTMGEISADYPATTDVRSGTAFNFGTQTGTLAVPAANQVSVGVAVDNTVGTAVNTQQDVADSLGPLLVAFSP